MGSDFALDDWEGTVQPVLLILRVVAWHIIAREPRLHYASFPAVVTKNLEERIQGEVPIVAGIGRVCAWIVVNGCDVDGRTCGAKPAHQVIVPVGLTVHERVHDRLECGFVVDARDALAREQTIEAVRGKSWEVPSDLLVPIVLIEDLVIVDARAELLPHLPAKLAKLCVLVGICD